MKRRKFLKYTGLLGAGLICRRIFGDMIIGKAPFNCARCGRCCAELVADDFWVGGPLTWAEKQHLLAERKKRPKHKKGGCKMLWFDEIAHCLVYDIYGSEKRDKNCQDYYCGE